MAKRKVKKVSRTTRKAEKKMQAIVETSGRVDKIVRRESSYAGKAMTLDALAILMAIDMLGPDVSTTDAAACAQRAGIELAKYGGSNKPALQGGLRQALNFHVKHGRLTFRKVPGLGHAGMQCLWSVTEQGKAEISKFLSAVGKLGGLKK